MGVVKILEISDKKGVSPIIATALTFLFAVSMITIALNVINPTFKRAKSTSVVNDAFQNINMINNAIKEVSSESEGSKRTISLSVADGTYRINSTSDWIYYEYGPEERMLLTGTKGDTYVERDLKFFDHFNWQVDGSVYDAWENSTGEWTISDYKFKGINGTAYRNISSNVQNWRFGGDISNISGTTGGQIFTLPVNPDNLVGYWVFDNRTGDQAYDYSGNDNNGTLTNMNTVGNTTSGWQDSTNCKAGNSCLMFDGVDDYIEVDDDTSLNPANLTVGAWFKLNSLSGEQSVVDKRGNGGYQIRVLNDGIRFILRNSSRDEFRVESNNVLTLGYHYMVGTWDGTTQRVYLDGALLDSDTPTIDDMTGSTNKLYVGEISGGTKPTAYNINGTIDEVMIFDVALTESQIESLYETSEKKLVESGSKSISAETKPNIVLSNPYGTTKFDNIKVSGGGKELSMVIPYNNIAIDGTLRAGKGDHKIEIKHMGLNTTLSKPIIEIGRA